MSCRYDDTRQSVCECKGEVTRFTGKGIVSYTRENTYVIVSDLLGVGQNCNLLADSLQIDGLKVSFSAKRVTPCPVFRSDLLFSKYEIIDVKRDNSVFQSGLLSIEIIHTQDYGYPTGFGYLLIYKPYNFSIVQKTIPYQYNVPFKTENDAFKIAVLFASKLEESSDFPKVSYDELRYLQINF